MEDNILAIISPGASPMDLVYPHVPVATTQAIRAWAQSSSDPSSPIYTSIVQGKVAILCDFFDYICKHPGQVSEADIQLYQQYLEQRNRAQSTIYTYISRISAFYEWMMSSPELAAVIHKNPTKLVRPKAPKPYQSKATKALSDDQAKALVKQVKKASESRDLDAKRDYAMLLIYFLTGMRREEVCSLKYGDITLSSVTPQSDEAPGSVMIISCRVKGGEIVTRELTNPIAGKALMDYLIASNRLNTMTPESPLWTRHDHAGKPGEPLTSHAFVKNLKKYALEIGLNHIHLHQTRHTFARIIADETGSFLAAQEALGHKDAAATRVYVQHLGTKKDRSSGMIGSRLDFDE